MRRMSKFKYFLRIFFTRGIIPSIIGNISLGIEFGTLFKISYYGFGNIALILLLALPFFLIFSLLVYGMEGAIIPLISEGIVGIILLILCTIIACLRTYAMGHLFDGTSTLLFIIFCSTLAVILERIMGLRNQDYNW